MPIYEYRCSSCNDDLEVTQKITDAPLKECPKCGGALEKLVSQSSFVLKGGGWYASDYGSKSSGDKPASKESGGCGSGAGCAGCPSASS